MKRLGFLSFGHWGETPHSKVRSAADVLLQSIDLAVESERLGLDGAYFRVHHFAQQLASPFPLLAAIGARTAKIEIGTAVIDMRYENPFYMAEDAGSADLIAGGRLQLGLSRGSPGSAVDGWRFYAGELEEGESDSDMSRRHTECFLMLMDGRGVAEPVQRSFSRSGGLLRVEPYSTGLHERIWWGAASDSTAVWAAKLGMNLQSSTLKFDESGEPFHIQQAKQIRGYREAWKEAGHTRTPRVSVSRSIFPIVSDEDRLYFGSSADRDHFGYIDGPSKAVFGRSYADTPEKLVEQLRQDQAIQEADTLLLTIPNQLGVSYNAHVLESVVQHLAPALGWR